MAWRDSRRNRSRLFIFISAIIAGIAALVAINTFSENLQKDVDREAKKLLGADLVLGANQPIPASIQGLVDSIEGTRSAATNFVSMAFFPKNEGSRLVQVKGVKGIYPYYGTLMTEPKIAATNYQEKGSALVEQTLMIQFDLEVGDSVRLGETYFKIGGILISAPGRSGVAGSFAPVIYVPQDRIVETGLVRTGSRVFYQYYFQTLPEFDVDEFVEINRQRFRQASLNVDTVESRREDLNEAFSDLNSFLNLVGFIALLLGCIGVASAIHVYIKDKIPTVAVLRCLGASGRQAFLIYLIQIFGISVLGAVMGAAIGTALQVALPLVLGSFLPVSEVSTGVSWMSVGQGIITGVAVAVLFALLSLLKIRKTSPLRAIRNQLESDIGGRDPLNWVVYGLITMFVCGFTYLQTKSLIAAISFPVAIIVAFGLLAGVAYLLMYLVRRFFPRHWSYAWRQGIANLYRPGNQTLILLVTIGLGTALLSTLFFTQELLLKQVAISGSEGRPNMILFDIQPEQAEGVAQLVRDNDLPVVQQVPIVTTRITEIDGLTKSMRLQDTTSKVKRWVFNREYRVTYRDTLIESETITDGVWRPGPVGPQDTIFISIAENNVDDMQVKIGSKVVFNVQGALLETYVGSVRKVDWQRLQTNFFVVFPTGVLEKAPHFDVIISRSESPEQAALFQRALVKGYPNVSVIELTQVLKAVDDVLGKASFVIRFMALFSILTGLLVLLSSVVLSKYQRMKESVLLRTLGASRGQILRINALEYLVMGALSALTGIGLSIIGAWLLAYFVFDIPFSFNPWPLLAFFVIITLLTLVIGLVNSRGVVNRPPLEVLRAG